jgi:phage/plasmid-like protein (TIGR03299 family)
MGLVIRGYQPLIKLKTFYIGESAMSHEIDLSTGRPAVFVTGEPAWHRLGTVISQAANSAEAITLAGLNWTVEQYGLSAAAPGEKWLPVPDKFANVRTDTNAVLGVVGNTYRVFQNAEAFDFMDAIVGDKLAMYETAGSLKGGRRVWMLARIPREYRIGRNDLIQPYVLLTNSHDGSQALRMLPTTIRVVCQNTLNLALRKAAGGLSIVHTASLDQRIEEARRNLGIISARMYQFNEEAQALAGKELNTIEVHQFFKSLFPLEGTSLKRNLKIHGLLEANFDNERNHLPGIEHSAWAAFNAVSEWADHQKRVLGRSDNQRDNNRLHSIWFGTANEIKQQAWSNALALVG